MLVGNVTLLAAILYPLQLAAGVFWIYWVRETIIKINLYVFYFKCGYEEILNYIYGCSCGSISIGEQ